MEKNVLSVAAVDITFPSGEYDSELLPFLSSGILSCTVKESTPCASKLWGRFVP